MSTTRLAYFRIPNLLEDDVYETVRGLACFCCLRATLQLNVWILGVFIADEL
jgi:hypothetical protein